MGNKNTAHTGAAWRDSTPERIDLSRGNWRLSSSKIGEIFSGERMRSFVVYLFVILLALTACQGSPGVTTAVPVEQGQETQTSVPATLALSASDTPSPTQAVTQTPTPLPAGLIQVDTFEQEVYPFVQNGKCSLGEAIFAANAGKPKDSCAAGVPGESVIELMPGEYRFTQRDQTPPQVEWATSVVRVGDALPP